MAALMESFVAFTWAVMKACIAFGLVAVVLITAGLGLCLAVVVLEDLREKRRLEPTLEPYARVHPGSRLADLAAPECVDDIDALERSLAAGGFYLMEDG